VPRGAVILLVDDDSAVRETTAALLRELGYGVVEAGSGGAALDKLSRKIRIDLLLVDFAMPGMNGAEVAREARQRRPGLPVIFATGYANVAALADVSEAHLIHKPYSAEDLAAKLARALGLEPPLLTRSGREAWSGTSTSTLQ
jgi:CheY-like chemotaxis protein